MPSHFAVAFVLITLLEFSGHAAGAQVALPAALVSDALAPDAIAPVPYQSSLLKPAKSLSLREAVLLAVRNNAALQTAYLDRVLDRFRLDYARSEFQPQGSLKFNSTRTRDGAASVQHAAALDMALALPTGARLQFGWDASRHSDSRAGNQMSLQWIQPLLRGAGTNIGLSNLRLAEIAEAQARLQLQANVMATVSAVITAYRHLLDTRQQIVLAHEALKRSRALADINQTLVDTGRMGKLELLQTQAEIASGELDVIQAQTNAENARLALLKLLDMDLLCDITPTEVDMQQAGELPSEAQALEMAESLRPDYLSAKLALRASELGLQKAQDQRLWQLDLVLAAARRKDDDAASTQRRNSNSASLQLTIPLNDRSSDLAASSAKIEVKKAALHSSDLRQALRVEVMNALRNAYNTKRQVKLAAQNLQLNQQKLEAELVKLSFGRTSLFQVTSFQQSLKQAEQTQINANTAWANALTQLDLTLGTTLKTWEILLD